MERVVLRKGAWLPRSFTLNALVLRLRTDSPPDICAFGDYCHRLQRLRQGYGGPGEKPIHLWLRLARDTRATTAVEAAVSAATIQNKSLTRLVGKPEDSFVSLVMFRSRANASH